MKVLSELIDQHGVDVLEHLDRQVSVPLIAGLQRQGDVIVIPAALGGRVGVAKTPVPLAGVAVVRGESGGNTHLLLAEGPVFFDGRTASGSDLTLGVLTVPDGSAAFLAHPEHGYTGIAAGTYRIGRQREQADEIRMVQD